MARLARKISQTGLYHIIFRGICRQNIFEDMNDYEKMLEVIKQVKRELQYDIYAYCLMTNHAHLFIKEKNAGDIIKIMSKILSQYAGWFNRKYLRSGALFGDRYKSEAIEDYRYLFSLVRYIHQNPLRAGIVSKLDDYKWSSYNDYIKPKENSLTDTGFILNQFSDDKDKAVELFIEFNNEIEDNDFTIADGRRKNEGSIKRIIMSLIDGEQPHTIKSMPKEKRDLIIYKLYKDEGLSKSVIERATGISRGTIIKIIKQFEMQ
ncbi:MAG: transposase [Clostridiaceae bacterium]|nr:transposase [Clostridiaceae bacterium]